MADLFWPGDTRAGCLFSDAALITAMVDVEAAWLAALIDEGIAPTEAAGHDLRGLVRHEDTARLETESESGGNPAMPLVSVVRERLAERSPDAARWLHRGLTSQDVVDSALMICARDAVTHILGILREQISVLSHLVQEHRGTTMVARTLTQHAVPTTFGLKAATWLTGVLDAYDDLSATVLPLQLGGAAGTMAGALELARTAQDPYEVVYQLTQDLARRLDLTPSIPWHTTRTTVTRLGDAAVRCTDAWVRIANDVLILGRPEIAELSEGTGGGSSTMPHKANPVLSTLVRRAALTTPQLAATLHLAAAESHDERSAGGWHAEWATLRTLIRRTVVAGEQTVALLLDLQVHAEQMKSTLSAAHEDAHAEQRSLAELAEAPPRSSYLGTSSAFLDAPLTRAAEVLAHQAPESPRSAHPEEVT